MTENMQRIVAIIVVLVATNIGTLVYYHQNDQKWTKAYSSELSDEANAKDDFQALMEGTGGRCRLGQSCYPGFVDCTEFKVSSNKSQCQLEVTALQSNSSSPFTLTP